MSPPTLHPLNALALKLKALHIPGDPLVLANVHDGHTARLVGSSPSCAALATASWAIAATQGIEDDDMTLADNLRGVGNVARGLRATGRADAVPLTVDLQDGYADVGEAVRAVVRLGAVGCNLEDVAEATGRGGGRLRGLDEAAGRVRAVLRAAAAEGVPDFVVNARTDAFGYGGGMDEVKVRARAYLDAGATAVFVWGVRVKEITIDEVRELVEVTGGRLAVHGPGPTKLGVRELAEAGVSRISVGPWLYRQAMEGFGEGAVALMSAK